MTVNTIRCRECGGYVELRTPVWPLTVVGSALCRKCLRARLLRVYRGTKSFHHVARLYAELRLLPRRGKARRKHRPQVGLLNRRRDRHQAKPMGKR